MASSSSSVSTPDVVSHFVDMGFPVELITKAIKDNGENNIERILESLLLSSVMENTIEDPLPSFPDPGPYDLRDDFADDSLLDDDIDNYHGAEDTTRHSILKKDELLKYVIGMGYSHDQIMVAIDKCGTETPVTELLDFIVASHMVEEVENRRSEVGPSNIQNATRGMENTRYSISEKDELLAYMVEMGYPLDQIVAAIDKCGVETPVTDLLDFIVASQMVERVEDSFSEAGPSVIQNATHGMTLNCYSGERKRKFMHGQDELIIKIPNPMVGFGIPYTRCNDMYRKIPEAAIGPPFFYFENVALAPNGEWETMSCCLYGIHPEFVDSSFFSAAARKRGYIHNLPLKNRRPLLPLPTKTIQEAFPSAKKWWPSWDPRRKFNCLQTCIGSALLSQRIRDALEAYDSQAEPPMAVQKFVLEHCRRWNLVWVGRNKVAPLEPHEMEMLQGFQEGHTRGISKTDRYKALGNTFQVDTVAYHLSVLRELYPTGINVLSLFSGIGGAEVALYRLGIPLKNVVSVEISKSSRETLASWWEDTNQEGNLIHVADVEKVTFENVEQWVGSFGGFDLVVGGSPCNNLSGSNRYHRNGLEGEHSCLFYDYCRILKMVKSVMQNRV